MFRKKQPEPSPQSLSDPILNDLPRGQEGRRYADIYPEAAYFEDLDVLKQVGFEDKAGHNFLGVVGGTTQRLLRDDGRHEFQTHGGTPIGVLDDRHMTTIAGSRSGKGRGIIIPQLLTYNGSIVCIDPKGENAAITARFRAEELKQDVHIIDPFGVTPEHCQKYRRKYNPVSILKPSNLNSIEDAGLLTDALVASVSTKDPHWDESAKSFAEALLLHVATGPYPSKLKNLNTVHSLLSGKLMSIEDLLAEMGENECLEGRILAGARLLKEMDTKERGSVLSTARRHCKFLDYPAIQSVFDGHDFDLNTLKTKKTTIYVVLPATRMSSCKGLLRLFVNLTLGMVEVETTKSEHPILAILDEMPIMGYMKQIEDAAGQVAGLGLRLHFILQDLTQIKSLYKDRYETMLGNSGVINCFGVVDSFTSEWISKYLGRTRVQVSQQNPTTIEDKRGGKTGQSYNSQFVPLLSEAEVRRFIARDDHFNRQLVLIPGKRPWLIQRVGYDNHDFFKGRSDSWR